MVEPFSIYMGENVPVHFVALLQEIRDQGRPTSLVASANTSTVITVKVLIE